MKQRHLLFFTFVSLSFASLFGQTDAVLSSTKQDYNPSEKLKTLDSLISYHRGRDIDKFITYSLEYIEIAKDIDAIKDAAKKAINVQNPLSSTKKKHQKAIQVLNSVLAEKYKLKDSFLLAHLYYKRGKSHYSLDLKKAISDYEKALEFYPKDSVLVIGDAYLFKGNANADLGNFIDATKDFESAYQAYKAKNDREYMLYARQGNINIYSMNGFNQKAIDLRKEIIADLKEDEKKLHSAILYYNQALDYKKIGSKSLLIASLLDAEDAITPNTSSFLKTGIQGAILEYYAEKSSINTPKVQKLFASIKSQLEDKEGQENYSLIVIHSALATYYYYANQYKKAL